MNLYLLESARAPAIKCIVSVEMSFKLFCSSFQHSKDCAMDTNKIRYAISFHLATTCFLQFGHPQWFSGIHAPAHCSPYELPHDSGICGVSVTRWPLRPGRWSSGENETISVQYVFRMLTSFWYINKSYSYALGKTKIRLAFSIRTPSVWPKCLREGTRHIFTSRGMP